MSFNWIRMSKGLLNIISDNQQRIKNCAADECDPNGKLSHDEKLKRN